MKVSKEACYVSNCKLIPVMTDEFASYIIIKAFKILKFTYDLVSGNYHKITELLLQNGKMPDGFRSLFYGRSWTDTSDSWCDRGRSLMYMRARECTLYVHTLTNSSRILSLSKHYALLVVWFVLQRATSHSTDRWETIDQWRSTSQWDRCLESTWET